MAEPMRLHSVDIPIALGLADAPGAKFADLAQLLGISVSAAFQGVRRLELAGLVRPEVRHVNWLALREFLAHGLRYAFPARPGAEMRGVPTSHAAPPLVDRILSDVVFVWPDDAGPKVGRAIAPLYRQASQLPARDPRLYELVALADALRVGRPRERKLALEAFDARLGPAATVE